MPPSLGMSDLHESRLNAGPLSASFRLKKDPTAEIRRNDTRTFRLKLPKQLLKFEQNSAGFDSGVNELAYP